MKHSIARIAILTLIIIGLLMVGYGLTVKPSTEAQAVGNGHSESVSFPSDTQARYAMQNDVPASLIGDCLADRVIGDLYPQPDPYCIPSPAVEPVDTVKEKGTDDTVITTITVEPPVITPPAVEPELPVIDDGGEEIPGDDQPEQTSGNPGNLKSVGHAGENPNGRGTMDNDNAGGNGNGEHGNQGEGGHN